MPCHFTCTLRPTAMAFDRRSSTTVNCDARRHFHTASKIVYEAIRRHRKARSCEHKPRQSSALDSRTNKSQLTLIQIDRLTYSIPFRLALVNIRIGCVIYQLKNDIRSFETCHYGRFWFSIDSLMMITKRRDKIEKKKSKIKPRPLQPTPACCLHHRTGRTNRFCFLCHVKPKLIFMCFRFPFSFSVVARQPNLAIKKNVNPFSQKI